VDSVHYIHQIEVAADGGHEGWIGSNVFVEVSNNTNRPTMGMMDGNFVRKVVNCLESGVWSPVTSMPEYVPLLGEDSMNTGLFDSCFAAIVKAVEDDLALVFHQ
jgi:hypothetical protein